VNTGNHDVLSRIKHEVPVKDITPKTLIGYTCSYIPVELLSATGLRPYRLLHGDIGLSKEGDKSVRIDACPLIKSNIAYVLKNRSRFAALVGSTGCDMSRRMNDVIKELTGIPVYVLNNPRTDNARIYNDEIDWLTKQLQQIARRKFTDQLIAQEITSWKSKREQLRVIDEKRKSTPSLVSTTDFHKACISYYQGALDIPKSLCTSPCDKPRVYLLGSAISYEANPILQLIENDLRIVGDYNCGLSRALNIRIKEMNVDGIKKAYYDQPPCIFKRPHKEYYDHIEISVNELNCSGIVAWTLDYCDQHEFEVQRIEHMIDRPVLRIRSDFSFQNMSQLRTRVDAFTEMLCAMK